MVLLHHTGEEAPHPDTVGSHDHRFLLSVLILEGAAQGIAVTGSQLEDVPHLHSLLRPEGSPADRAEIPLGGGGYIGDDIGRVSYNFV